MRKQKSEAKIKFAQVSPNLDIASKRLERN